MVIKPISGKIKVLIVESLAEVRSSFQSILNQQTTPSYSIESVSTLKEALKILSTSFYDVILLDLFLSDSKGFETSSKITAVSPKSAIVFLIDSGQDEKTFKAVRRYSKGFLEKTQKEPNIIIQAIILAIEYKQVENNLRRAVKEKANVFNGMSALVVYQDLKMRVLWANRGAVEYVKKPLEQLIGQHCYEIWHHRSSPCEGCPVIEAQRTGQAVGKQILTPDGRAWFVHGTPEKDENGNIIGILEMALENTEYQRMQKLLQASEEKYRGIFEMTGTAMVIMNKDLVITLANQGFEKLSGYSREEVVGKKSAYDFIAKEDLARIEENHRLRLNDPDSVSSSYEFVFIDRHGTKKDVYITVNLIPGTTDSIASILDITQRRQAENLLKDSEQRYQIVAAQSGQLIYDYDLKTGKIIWVGTIPDLTGYSYEEFQKTDIAKWEDMIHPDDREEALELLEQAKEKLGKYQAEYRFRHKDGHYFYVEDEGVFIPGKDRQARRMLGVMRDVTQRKLSESKLRQSEERYRTLAEAAQDIIFIINRDGLVQYVNSFAASLFNKKPEEIIGQPQTALFPPEVAQRHWKVVQGIMKSGEPVYIENTTPFMNQEVWLGTWLAPIKNEQGFITSVLGISRDVTQRRKAEQSLREEKDKLQRYLDIAGVMFVVIDANEKVILINKKGCQVLGYEEKEIIGKNWFDHFIPERIREEVRKTFSELISGNVEPVEYFENYVLMKSGEERLIVWHNTVFQGKQGKVNFILGSGEDVTEKRKAEEKLNYLAYHDTLTDLPNRILFIDRLNQALISARHEDNEVGVIFLGLDHFKRINDTLGRSVGDQLLQAIGKRLRGNLHETDTLTRIGGDEFAIMLPRLRQRRDATKVADRILTVFKSPFFISGYELFMSCSIGISFYPTDGEDAELLLKNADVAMYRAKEHGRSNYQLYSATMNVAALKQLEMENSLRHALERKEMLVYYQPIIDLGTGRICSIEALLRWKHPSLGFIPANEFIPMAEDMGLIIPIGEWVLRTACIQNKKFQEEGFPLLSLSVNLSARQFQQSNLVLLTSNILQESGLKPEFLELELTEGVIMQDVEEAIKVLKKFNTMGVKIAIDDFGTGYSSLNYLKRFPIHTLKIDRTFIRDIIADPEDAAITKTVINMAHSLKLGVIAEGVETDEQLQFLRMNDCDRVQGFLFSEALPAEALKKFMSSLREPLSRKSKAKTK